MTYPKRIEEIFQMIGEKYAKCESSLRSYFDEQQENLAKMEAERNEWTLLTMDVMIQRDTAQVQLADAVELIKKIEQRMYGEDVKNRFLDLTSEISAITEKYEDF